MDSSKHANAVGKEHDVKRTVLLCLAVIVLVSGCSIQKLAMNMLADTLSGVGGEGNAFMRDSDPLLVADALPFTIKLYEILLEQNPTHRQLIMTTGSLFVMYANAFVWAPAEMYPPEEYEAQYEARMRAKSMYLRGRDLLLTGMELKYPGFTEAALSGRISEYLPQLSIEDIDYLYWIGAGWFGAFSLDNFDVELSITAKTAADLMARAYELDPEYSDRTIDDFYIAFHASAPDGYGANRDMVDYHFQRVLDLRGESSVGPYVTYALSVAVPAQDYATFREMIQTALAIPIEDYPEQLLLNTINRTRAQYFWETREELFIEVLD